ncbi:MAG: flagellar motor protein MotA [Pseudomonadota bacterium]
MDPLRKGYLWLGTFLSLVAAVVAVLYPALVVAFLENPVFNGVILGVLLVGIGVNVRQIQVLRPDRDWLRAYRQDGPVPNPISPRLLAPLAKVVAPREGAPVRLSAPAMRALLDGIRSRLDEGREVAHYLTGLLVFLGLLGTFWGLLQTVSAVSEVIAGLPAGGDTPAGALFERLRSDLQAPLSGMGTAFSSSLFGLAGALVLGFVDLQAGHVQNRLFNELEEALAERAHSLPEVEGGGNTEWTAALLERAAEGLEEVQRTLTRAEEERRATDGRLSLLAERLGDLSDGLKAGQQGLADLGRSQEAFRAGIERLNDNAANRDTALETRLRQIDDHLARLVEETREARRETVDTLRSEVRILGRALGRGEE